MIHKGKVGLIYFISCDATGHIKIGWTSGDPRARMGDLQVGCPFRLSVLATIGGKSMVDEEDMHRRFAKYRVSGEWFEGSEEIFDCIAEEAILWSEKTCDIHECGKDMVPFCEFRCPICGTLMIHAGTPRSLAAELENHDCRDAAALDEGAPDFEDDDEGARIDAGGWGTELEDLGLHPDDHPEFSRLPKTRVLFA